MRRALIPSRRQQRISVVAAVPIIVLCLGGWQQSRSGAAATPAFATDVAPILQKNCAGCHSSTTHKGGLVLDSYDTLMKGGQDGQVVVAHDAKNSLLLEMIDGTVDPRMPLKSDPLPAKDIAVIRSWINAGAAAPTPGTVVSTATPALPAIVPQTPAVSPVSSVKFSRDGRVLAVGGFQRVELVDTASGKVTAELTGHADAVRSVTFSPDGKMIAAAGGRPQRQGEIKIWDLQSHQLIKTLKGHADSIYSIAWSPDGKLIASGSYDKLVKLWDVESGKELHNLQDHIDAVFAVAFSPDGKHLASASQDRTVKIWDISTGKRLYTLSDAADGLTTLAYSSKDDKLAAAGYDKTIYIWQLAEDDGHLIHSLIADEDSVLSLAWSHDGDTLVTASSDGSIRFRDPDLNLKGVVDHQPDWVQSLDLSADGKWLAAGRYNGSLSFYDAKTYTESHSISVFDQLRPIGNSKSQEAASR